jgi:putative redox protein
MGLVIVRSRGGANDLRTEVSAGSHTFTSDEPPGSDEGPSPYDLLVAALGSCTAVTLEIYALRMAWPLERVVVRLRHDHLHAKDSASVGEDFLDRIDREIVLEGRLTPEQRAELLRVAEGCPVARSLSSAIEVVTQLAGTARAA